MRINPELGLEIDGKLYAVKLYFKDEKPTTQRLKVVFEIMRLGLNLDGTMSSSVLDVSSGNLKTPKTLQEDLSPLLEAQAGAFMHLWKAIANKAPAAS